MPVATRTRSQIVSDDVHALLRARNPILWIVTREEQRVEKYIFEAAAAAGYPTRCWDIAQGVTGIDGKFITDKNGGRVSDYEYLEDPDAALKKIAEASDRCVWIMRDLPIWISGPTGAAVLRRLRNLARFLPAQPKDNAQAIVVLSPNGEVPAELANHSTVIEWPLPDRAEIGQMLDAAVEALPADLQKTAATNGTRDAAIDAAVGLSGEEAEACFARSLVQLKKIDPATITREKKNVIARERVLEWYDPLPGGLDAVGGLENLKQWLIQRASAYSPKARAYGLPAPKGALLVGIPGCGKSLTAKAIATAWGVPLLRLDLGALKSKFVGESEGNLRKALAVIEAIGRCVVWLDEIEKALDGATSGSADGGVSADALGTILSWMQDRGGEAFVIATANDATKLPPELIRKGRFDEVWWIDTPNPEERVAILAATLKSYDRDPAVIDLDAVAHATDQFTGAEIAALVPDALFTAFADDLREINTEDLLRVATDVTPLTTSAAPRIDKLRTEWGNGKARDATRKSTMKDVVEAAKTGRQIDIS